MFKNIQGITLCRFYKYCWPFRVAKGTEERSGMKAKSMYIIVKWLCSISERIFLCILDESITTTLCDFFAPIPDTFFHRQWDRVHILEKYEKHLWRNTENPVYTLAVASDQTKVTFAQQQLSLRRYQYLLIKQNVWMLTHKVHCDTRLYTESSLLQYSL